MIRRSAAAVLLAVALAGCGVPTDNEARAVALPSPEPESTDSGVGEQITVAIYLVGPDNLLQPVSRTVTRADGVQALLDELAAGPTDAQNAAGLRSVLTGATGAATAQQVNPDGTFVVVQFADQLAGLAGAEQLLGVGQIAVTLGAAGAERVEFTDSSGNVLGVPLPDGTVSTGLVDPASYAALVR